MPPPPNSTAEMDDQRRLAEARNQALADAIQQGIAAGTLTTTAPPPPTTATKEVTVTPPDPYAGTTPGGSYGSDEAYTDSQRAEVSKSAVSASRRAALNEMGVDIDPDLSVAQATRDTEAGFKQVEDAAAAVDKLAPYIEGTEAYFHEQAYGDTKQPTSLTTTGTFQARLKALEEMGVYVKPDLLPTDPDAASIFLKRLGAAGVKGFVEGAAVVVSPKKWVKVSRDLGVAAALLAGAAIMTSPALPTGDREVALAELGISPDVALGGEGSTLAALQNPETYIVAAELGGAVLGGYAAVKGIKAASTKIAELKKLNLKEALDKFSREAFEAGGEQFYGDEFRQLQNKIKIPESQLPPGSEYTQSGKLFAEPPGFDPVADAYAKAYPEVVNYWKLKGEAIPDEVLEAYAKAYADGAKVSKAVDAATHGFNEANLFSKPPNFDPAVDSFAKAYPEIVNYWKLRGEAIPDEILEAYTKAYADSYANSYSKVVNYWKLRGEAIPDEILEAYTKAYADGTRVSTAVDAATRGFNEVSLLRNIHGETLTDLTKYKLATPLDLLGSETSQAVESFVDDVLVPEVFNRLGASADAVAAAASSSGVAKAAAVLGGVSALDLENLWENPSADLSGVRELANEEIVNPREDHDILPITFTGPTSKDEEDSDILPVTISGNDSDTIQEPDVDTIQEPDSDTIQDPDTENIHDPDPESDFEPDPDPNPDPDPDPDPEPDPDPTKKGKGEHAEMRMPKPPKLKLMVFLVRVMYRGGGKRTAPYHAESFSDAARQALKAKVKAEVVGVEVRRVKLNPLRR